MTSFEIFTNGTIHENGSLVAKVIHDPKTGQRWLHLRDDNGPVKSGGVHYTKAVSEVARIYYNPDKLKAELTRARDGSQ